MSTMEQAKKTLISHFHLSIVSFTIVTLIVIKVCLFSIAMTLRWEHWLSAGFKTICVLLLVYEVLHELKNHLILAKDRINQVTYERSYHSVVTAVIMGALVTFFIINELHLDPVVASSIVGLIGAMASKRYQVPIYCGSFVGMSSMALYGGYQNFLFSAILAGTLFLISGNIFSGSGGKLGIIAFWGTLLYAMLTGNAYTMAPVESGALNHWIFLYLMSGAMVTFLINRLSRLNAVESSALIGLIAGLVLPIVHGASGGLLASVVFCGSFIGMSSHGRLASMRQVIGAAAVAAIFFIYTQNVFVGLGGKLGVIAFTSVFVVNGYLKVRSYRFSVKPSMGREIS